jgi:hypothetical protein
MLRDIRKRITPATVIATLALVFAMTGGAYAASKVLITSTKQISPKVLKSLKGATGKAGANGATGSAGPAGPAGGAGPTGPAGSAGSAGTAGAKGEAGSAGPTGATGKEGKEGKTGFTKTLPSGQTETGVWGLEGTATSEYFPTTSISFPIPLEKAAEDAAFGFSKTATENKEFGTTGCTGSAANPTAPKGVLCVYTAYEEGVNTTFFTPSAGIPGGELESYATSGAVVRGADLQGTAAAPANVTMGGTWAVTAP